jgi:5-methylcytosine-specific restriction enzyme B
MAEASPICRGKNLTVETVMAFVNAMPLTPMKKTAFHNATESKLKGWTQTHSQIARQLALYYEENGVCYPRFTHKVTYSDVLKYVTNWAMLYCVPNPYTPSLESENNKVTNIYAFIKNKVLNGMTSYNEACTSMFGIELNNTDKVRVYLNNFTDLIISDDSIAINDNLIIPEMLNVHPSVTFSNNKEFFDYFSVELSTDNAKNSHETCSENEYRSYITAIKSKPFLLLAGISGTGKSRIVRELARACWEEGSEEYKAQKPRNFEMVQVKPNWHDSSELIGYVSRVSGKAEFVAGDFLKFVAKAWEDPNTPYFLCLDEMNLAPVEQYFAEYLSVVESRNSGEDGVVTTDPILKKEDAEWYFNLTVAITSDDKVRERFNKDGICIPQNLIVVGTVNMDETTFSFSRKVLDRAMTIEMNDVNLHGGLTKRHESIGKLGNTELVGSAVEGVDVYSDYTGVCDTALGYLQKVNDVLEGTPFKIAYRTRNEFLLYVVNNLPYNKDKDGNDLPQGYVIARALDEITSMKILSRIEGDDTKVKDSLLNTLSQTITDELNEITDEDHPVKSVSVAKLEEMKNRLQSGYTSFWS